MRLWLKFIHQLDCFFIAQNRISPESVFHLVVFICTSQNMKMVSNISTAFSPFTMAFFVVRVHTQCKWVVKSGQLVFTLWLILGIFGLIITREIALRSSSCETVNRIIAAKRFTGNSEYPILDSFHVNEHNGVNNRYFTLIAHACNLHALASSKLKREKHCSQTHFVHLYYFKNKCFNFFRSIHIVYQHHLAYI